MLAVCRPPFSMRMTQVGSAITIACVSINNPVRSSSYTFSN
jgi:hypothetical protein